MYFLAQNFCDIQYKKFWAFFRQEKQLNFYAVGVIHKGSRKKSSSTNGQAIKDLLNPL